MSVTCNADAKGASVCDEGTFRFPEECCLQPFSFSSPKSSQEGVVFPLRPRTRFQTKCGVHPIVDILLRATLVTPPPFGHPLYEQRGSLQASYNKHVEITLISNSRYIILPKNLFYLSVYYLFQKI